MGSVGGTAVDATRHRYASPPVRNILGCFHDRVDVIRVLPIADADIRFLVTFTFPSLPFP